MADAVASARAGDLARAITSVGPHRDEIGFRIDGFDSRTEASQGEQRTLALALRIAGHELVTDRVGEPPLLLLDDVLSELDTDRSSALLANLPPGQTSDHQRHRIARDGPPGRRRATRPSRGPGPRLVRPSGR